MTVKKFARRWLILAALIGIGVSSSAGWLDPVIVLLKQDEFSIRIGERVITFYDIVKSILVIVATFWIASIIIDFLESRVGKISRIRFSTRALIVKAIQVVVYFVAFLASLDVLGIDLTALTVFGGALGIGLGFGFQKIASNFMSGLILLFEKSIEKDDLIELSDGTFGFIRNTGARFTLIETFDGKEIMIPNEDFITSRVINWTYTTKQGRLEIPIGISYNSDTRKAMELLVEAAREHPKCSTSPEPVCFVRQFGDSSVNLLLYFWMDDVTEGRHKPQSDVMLAIQDKFHANGIEIPFPQRDLHIKPGHES